MRANTVNNVDETGVRDKVVGVNRSTQIRQHAADTTGREPDARHHVRGQPRYDG
jgi:hypothetical protein